MKFRYPPEFDKGEGDKLSVNPFEHSNSYIQSTMPYLLAILREHGTINGDSESTVAMKCLELYKGRSRLGRSTERRSKRMLGTIGVATSRGFVSFSPKHGLQLTEMGIKTLKLMKVSRANIADAAMKQRSSRSERKHGRQRILPSPS